MDFNDIMNKIITKLLFTLYLIISSNFLTAEAGVPLISSPNSGSIFSSSSVPFILNNNGQVVTNWNLRVGSNFGADNLANRSAAGSSSSITVHHLPTDSTTIFVRLQYKENGIWKIANDYTYTASPSLTLPTITSPVSGSTLTSSSEIFTLDNNGLTITNWNIRLGTSLGSYDLANRFAAGSSTQISVTDLPTDSSPIFVRLQYKENGVWKVANDFIYTASMPLLSPSITYPSSGSMLTSSTVNFLLDNNGRPLTNWYLSVGSSLGANDIANRFAANTSTSITINNLPTDGRETFVRLQYKEYGIWKTAEDYTYTAATSLTNYGELGPYQPLRYPENGLTDDNYVIYYPQNAITADMPVIVFLEGGGNTPTIDDYQGTMMFLASQGYYVIGAESGGSYDSDYARSIVQSAIDLSISAHGLTLSKLAVMGHSQGGGQAFYVMRYFQDPANGGLGSIASLVLSIDGWFSFTMNQEDLATLHGNIAFIQMNDLIGTGTDPRIHLSIWNLSSNTENKFLTLPHNDHSYIKGDLNTLLNGRTDILYQLGALTSDAFNNENNGYASIPITQKATFNAVFNALMPENQYSADCEGVAYNARQNQLRHFNIDYCAMTE